MAYIDEALAAMKAAERKIRRLRPKIVEAAIHLENGVVPDRVAPQW
jgi:hypothetical protein